MWLSYLLGFAVIIILIRIVIFAFGGGSFEERLSKARNWILGLMLFLISWTLIAKIFKINPSLKIDNEHKIKEQNSNSNTEPNSVPIIIE